MVGIAKAETSYISFGQERDIPVTVASVSSETITSNPPTTMITDLYIGCLLKIKSCAGNTALNNKYYVIVDNTDNDIEIDTDLSGDLAAADTAVIVAFGAPPLNTTAKAALSDWIGIMTEFQAPDPKYEVKRYRYIGGTRDFGIAADGFISCTGKIPPFTVQNGKFLKFLLGRIYETGTDSGGGGGSDLDGAVEAGDTVVTLTSASGYAADDVIQITTGTNSECRLITAVTGNNITLAAGLDRDHADAEVCNEVIAPFTHVLEGQSRVPTFSLERRIVMASDLITYHCGNAITKFDFSGEEKGDLKLGVDILGSRPFKHAGDPNTVTALSTAPYLFHQAQMTLFGSIFARMKEWSLSGDNKLKDAGYWRRNNGAYSQDVIEEEREYQMTVKANIVDSTLYDQLTARSAVTAQLDFSRGASDTLQILCSNCEIEESPHPIPEKGAFEPEMVLFPKTVKITIVDSVNPY
jgi:hypothetical protein